MKVVVFTISYMNDHEEVSEWLDIFYSSLHYLRDTFEKFEHYIVLNEENVEKAKQNIYEKSRRYDIQNYSVNFKESKFSGTNGTGSQHAKTFRKHISDLKMDYDLSNFDFILIQEFDCIYNKKFPSFLKKSKQVLELFDDCLIGETRANTFRCPDFNKNDSKSLKTFLENKKDNVKKLDIVFSRVYPHLLIFKKEGYDKILKLKKFFRRKSLVSAIRELEQEKNKNEEFHFNFIGETGSDFFKKWVQKDNTFLKISEPESFIHYKGLYTNFNRYIKTNDSDALSNLKNSHKFIKENFGFLNFDESSIFKEDFKSYYNEFLS